MIKNILLALQPILFVSLTMACSSAHSGEQETDTKGSAWTRVTDENVQTVPFVTVRNRTGSNRTSRFFGDERGPRTAGNCDVAHRPLNALTPLAERARVYVPEQVVRLIEIREIPLEEIWRNFENTLSGRNPVLYTHGYFVNFGRGCRRVSLLQESLGLAGRLLFFSWPSEGAILNYARDEADLYWSVPALENLLIDMVTRFGVGKIDVLAHSLGTRGVFLALVQISRTEQHDKPLVNELVLLAADIDVGIFEQHLAEIQPLVRNITVYVSGNDRSLALSKQLHGQPRLGQPGSHLDELTGIDIVDISDMPVRYPSGHVYHLYHDRVFDDLDQLLNDGTPASNRKNLKQTGNTYWRMQQPATVENGK